MIKIYQLDNWVADVTLVGKKLHIRSYAGDGVIDGIESMRGEMNDKQLYDSLVERLTAGYARSSDGRGQG